MKVMAYDPETRTVDGKILGGVLKGKTPKLDLVKFRRIIAQRGSHIEVCGSSELCSPFRVLYVPAPGVCDGSVSCCFGSLLVWVIQRVGLPQGRSKPVRINPSVASL